jgi:hypothetical protein
MSDFQIDFEWPVAKYEYESVADIFRKYGEHPDFFPDARQEEVPDNYGFIVCTGEAKNHRPTPEAMKNVVRLLVEHEKIPMHKVALTIARAVGVLNLHDSVRSEHILRSGGRLRDRIDEWEWLQDYLRGIFRGEHKDFDYVDNIPMPRIGEVGVFLGRDKAGELEVALRPTDLAQALILYAARMVSTGTTFNTCEHCGNPFLSGGAGRGKSKKRADARFCSASCRWTHHNKLKSKHGG